MSIGDKVRAAEEQKAEAAMNAEGKLSGRQLIAVVKLGMTPDTAMKLAESGIAFTDIEAIAETQHASLMQASSAGLDLQPLLTQHAAQMETVISRSRNRKPESYNGDIPHLGISHYNPDGLAKPAPALKCKMSEGFWDEETQKAVARWDIEGCVDGLGPNTKLEVQLANLLEPGEFRVRNHDGDEGLVRVVAQTNEATGAVTQLIIAYPQAWVRKDTKGRLKPSLLRTFCDIYGADGEKPAQLQKWLDARKEMVAA